VRMTNENRKSIYIAGPMRNLPEFNFPAFMAKQAELEAKGDFVFNPAERDIDVGFDPAGMEGTEDLTEHGFSVREALAVDTEFICKHATHVHMLPGWSRSTGATAERALAIAIGIEVEGAPA